MEERIAAKRKALKSRSARLTLAHRKLEQQAQDLRLFQKTAQQNVHKYSQLRARLAQARGRLLSGLEFIFKIEPTDRPLQFKLVDLALPNSENLSEDQSAVLGITALLVNILAAYLGVALHYPLLFAGCRSLAVDNISLIKGPRSWVFLHPPSI